ncbi:MAG TPA: respiratory nitrate reductase subunit gamma [Thermodesulfobacteriota bacterium]|nr:respiratory nitrate reductase subunit gamma [Thermodesulfobacteriota bacterium]
MFNTFAFLVFPYISLTIFVVGFLHRYYSDALNWNAKSSELLDKGSLKWGAMLFHYGVLLTFIGHAAGLLVPQSLYEMMGFSGEAHTKISVALGIPFGLLALFGLVWLILRRLSRKRVRTLTTMDDWVTVFLLLFVIGVGFRNVTAGHFYVLDTVAPWIRSIVTFRPQPELMTNVPWAYKLHVLGAFVFFAFSPFSRMVHAWSYPFTYIVRRFILFRRREGAI